MRNGYGMSAKNGRKDIKSKVSWIEYEIDWFALAKKNCKKCYGRGYMGYEPQTEDQKERDEERQKLLCDCVANEWPKMTDEERLMFATRKPNADEIVEKAKEEIRKIAEEEMKNVEVEQSAE